MWIDPIVKEVREAREAYSAKFGHDLRKIAQDLRKKQAKQAAKTPSARGATGRKRRGG